MVTYDDFDPVFHAARGAKLLDKRRPGWAREMNRDELEMESCLDCVLGQLFGDYSEGFERLDLVSGSHYGFDVPFSLSKHGAEAYRDFFRRLNDAWRAEIARRMEARP